MFFIYTNAHAQTNSINIGSAQQNTDAGITYNAWKVTAMSTAFQTAPCYANTSSPTAPSGGAVAVSPVTLGQAAKVLSNYSGWPSGTYLSPFQYNTIYTPIPSVTNFSNSTATFSRSFFVCTSSSEVINFNLTINADDNINNIILDKGTVGEEVLFNNTSTNGNLFSPVVISLARTLSRGVHTITIEAAEWESPSLGSYYTVAGILRQWNPFGVCIKGTITSANNVLSNSLLAEAECITTPVTLVDFSASEANESIVLNWKVAEEISIKNYTIERSRNGSTDFVTVGNVLARNFASNTSYSFSDKNVLAGVNYYYRVCINEISGQKIYSAIQKSVIKNTGNVYVTVYPNPSRGMFAIRTNESFGVVNIAVINGAGQTVVLKQNVLLNRANSVSLNLYHQAKGTYWVKVISNFNTIVKKIIKR